MGGIDGGELAGQRLSVRGVRRAIAPRRTHHTYARAEDDDSREEQQCFSFGGRWHGDKIVSPVTSCIICLF